MRASQSMAVVGLTGGIAAGKSTVAARWKECGATVIDADLVAREVVEPGHPAHASIRGTFGKNVLTDSGAIDRGALGKIVFADPTKLAMLNAIVHPAIMGRVGEELIKHHGRGVPWVVYEAALIIENGLNPGLTELVTLMCDPALQLRRLMARNGLSQEESELRIAAQTTNAKRREVAQHVIMNDGSVDALIAAADQAFERLQTTYGAI